MKIYACDAQLINRYYYYGPYEKLLNYYCFGDSFQYFVAPQSPPIDLTLRDTVDFAVFLVVFDANRHLVFFCRIQGRCMGPQS